LSSPMSPPPDPGAEWRWLWIALCGRGAIYLMAEEKRNRATAGGMHAVAWALLAKLPGDAAWVRGGGPAFFECWPVPGSNGRQGPTTAIRRIAGSPSVGPAFDPGFDRIFGAPDPNTHGENGASRVAIRPTRAGDAREGFARVLVRADRADAHTHASGLGRRFGGNRLRRLPLRPLGREGAGTAIPNCMPGSVGSVRGG